MLATAPRSSRKPLLGTPRPRIGPPLPLRSDSAVLVEQAADLDMPFLPWQETVARYIEARGKASWQYPEVFIGAGRQNGKTWILTPHIVRRLRMHRRVLYASGTGRDKIAKEIFHGVVDQMQAKYPALVEKVRYASGQEELVVKGGGRFITVAPTRSAARGLGFDDLIVDEVCELHDLDFIGAAIPTLSASVDPQTVYVSNAGTPESIVLESLRARSDGADPNLAFLEWSADPEYAADDPRGWAQGNPSIGHIPTKLANIDRAYRAAQLGNTLSIFEREILCRTTVGRRELLVGPEEWAAQAFTALPPVTRAVMAVKMDVSGERASAIAAWPLPNGRVALEVVLDEVAHPLNADLLGPELVRRANARRALRVGFDAYTDADLIRLFPKDRVEAVRGGDYAKASEGFVRRARARDFIVADELGLIAGDLSRTIRKAAPNGTYIGAKATSEPNTAAQAAIAAAWLATRNPYASTPSRGIQ